MDIRQLRVIQMVCETGSVTETAKRMHVSQPAISKTIKLVEEETGLQLFENIQGRLFPTTEMQTLLPEISRLLNTHQDVRKQVENLRAGKSGVVRLAISPSLMPRLAAPAIRRFQAARPDVEVKVFATSTRQVVAMVANHDVDAGVCQPSSGDPTVHALPISTARVICILPENHRLARKEAISPFDLDGESVITFPDTEPTAVRVVDAFINSGARLNRTIETNMSFTACCLAMQGCGVALVDSFIHTADYFPKLAVRPFVPEIPLHVNLHVSSLRKPSLLVQELVQELIAVGKESQPGGPPSSSSRAALRKRRPGEPFPASTGRKRKTLGG